MIRSALVIAAVVLGAPACSIYSPPPQPSPRAASAPASMPFVDLTAEHVALIRSHYGANTGTGRGRGRGNAGLPPGIARNLARGKPLPPGIAKQYLPGSVLTRIPAAPDGLEYVVMAGKLLLVDAATQIVRRVLLESVFG